MTRDAKIGLLLGLIFIFVIAFIINGLPKLRGKAESGSSNGQMVGLQNATPGIGGPQREVQRVLRPSIRVVNRMEDQVQAVPETQVEIEAPTVSGEELRYQRDLPAGTSVANTQIETEPDRLLQQAIETANESVDEGPPMIDIGPVSTPISTPRPEPAAVVDAGAGRVVKPRAARVKSYVVAPGDNLATIAQKVYGAEEGNRHVNIERIFKVNRGVLKSADEIYVGQKLKIPALANSLVAVRPSDVLSGDQFDRRETVGERRAPSGKANAGANTAGEGSRQYKQYVVLENDSLWKIAAEQLGNGSRYKEIVKLNADVLKDEDVVAVSMRLKMPVK